MSGNHGGNGAPASPPLTGEDAAVLTDGDVMYLDLTALLKSNSNLTQAKKSQSQSKNKVKSKKISKK